MLSECVCTRLNQVNGYLGHCVVRPGFGQLKQTIHSLQLSNYDAERKYFHIVYLALKAN